MNSDQLIPFENTPVAGSPLSRTPEQYRLGSELKPFVPKRGHDPNHRLASWSSTKGAPGHKLPVASGLPRSEFGMSNSACILVYGRDPGLLETRCMLLETTGRVVHATTESEHAEQIIREEHPDLLVLCYTLCPDDRSSILSAAQHLRPEMKTLILTADGTSETGKGDLDIFTGARALRAKVVEMLDRKQSPAD